MPEFLEDFWTDYSLHKPDLKCLRQDAALYRTMLMQVHGQIEYDNTGIWLHDSEAAELKFNNTIKLAYNSAADVFVIPEYACPWASFIAQVKSNCIPDPGAVWILGCQSIRPKQLKVLMDENPDIVWIYDQQLINQNIDSNKFLDPACIVFKTTSLDGDMVTVVIVQFKTYFFGGKGFEWERDNLIPGNKFYIVSNQQASIRLLVLICSDTLNPALNVETANTQFVNIPFLLVHIQLNQQPNGLNYKTYRNTIFARGYIDKEVICLNWARNIQAEGKPWNAYGGSALYIKSDKLDLTDIRVNENHKYGLYYTRWQGRRTHVYLLNFDECIFIFDNTKPSQLDADPSQLNRSGPKMVSVFQHDGSDWKSVASVDDGLALTCKPIEESEGSLSCLKDNSDYINVERLVQLASGDINLEQDWHQIDKLKSVILDDAEQNRRVLFTHDPSTDIITERTKKLLRYSTLKHRILSSEIVPPIFKSLNLNIDPSLPTIDRYLLNVHSRTDFVKGTAVYIGDSLPYQAMDLRAKISGLFKDTHFGKNVMIFYVHSGLTKVEFGDQNATPKTAENVTKSQVSIKRTGSL